MENTFCKPTTIEPRYCPTVWSGCPVGESGRVCGPFGVVIHVVQENTIDNIREAMNNCQLPTLLPNNSYSYHYTIDNLGGLTQHIDDNSVSWSAGFYCNYPVKPEFDNIEYQGWPTHPDDCHLSESSIHVAIGNTPSGTAYDALVRLLSYLHSSYGIPFDTEHMAQYASIIQLGGVLFDPSLIDVVLHASEYCERCCDTIAVTDEPLEFVSGYDAYGCPNNVKLEDIICDATVNNGRNLDFDTDLFLVKSPEHCLEAVSLGKQDIFDIVCEFIIDDERLFDIENDSLLIQTADDCMEAVTLTRELVFGYVCDLIVDNDRPLDFDNDLFLVQTPDNCMEAVGLNREDIFNIVCEFIIDDGRLFDIENDSLLVQSAGECMEAVILTRELVFGYVCDLIVNNDRALDFDVDLFLVQTPDNCMEAVSLNREDIFDIVCDFIVDDGRLFDIENDNLLVQTADECMEAVTLTREIVFGYVCDLIVSNGRALDFDNDLFLVQSSDECMETVSLNGEDIFDIVCDFIVDDGRLFDIENDSLLVQTADECMEAVTLTRELVFGYVCDSITDNGRVLDFDTDSFLVQTVDECMEAVSLDREDIFDIVCDFIVDDGRSFDIDNDNLLVQTADECMEAVILTRELVFGYVCDLIVDNGRPIDIDTDQILVQNANNCMETTTLALQDTSCIDLSFNNGAISASPILAPTYGAMPDGCNGLVCGPDGLSAPACVENTIICPDLTSFWAFHIDVPQGFHTAQVQAGETSNPITFTNDSCYRWIIHLQCLSVWDTAIEFGSGVLAYFDVSVDNGVNWTPYSILWHKAYQTYETDPADPDTEIWHDRHWHRYSETQTVCQFMNPGQTFDVITRVRLGGIQGNVPLTVNRIASCLGFHRVIIESIATCPQ